MNKLITFILFLIIVTAIMSLTISNSNNNQIKITSDSLDADKQKYVDAVLETIKGKEKMPADSVFKDIQILKDVPAERLLEIMNKGFSRALGVSCEHCHNTENFASNERDAKLIARQMMNMTGNIRGMLKDIKEIKTENPNVTCSTCHRGSIIPATKMN